MIEVLKVARYRLSSGSMASCPAEGKRCACRSVDIRPPFLNEFYFLFLNSNFLFLNSNFPTLWPHRRGPARAGCVPARVHSPAVQGSFRRGGKTHRPIKKAEYYLLYGLPLIVNRRLSTPTRRPSKSRLSQFKKNNLQGIISINRKNAPAHLVFPQNAGAYFF